MIARHEAQTEKHDIWSKLSAPLPGGSVSWRQDGKAMARDGRFFARFVAYVEANTVRERLDGVVPGEWDLTLELLPSLPARDEADGTACSFKARLQILGVIREDVGTGRDYKSAATDAFKRAAVRFGIAHELYDYEQNWVQVDSDSKYAKPLEDPGTVYHRRYGAKGAAGTTGGEGATAVERDAAPMSSGVAAIQAAEPAAPAADAVVKPRSRKAAAATATEVREVRPEAAEPPVVTDTALASAEPPCPKCGGRMWDNRATKRNPKAPDYKCRDRSCDGVIWPPRGAQPADGQPSANGSRGAGAASELVLDSSPLGSGGDDIPF